MRNDFRCRERAETAEAVRHDADEHTQHQRVRVVGDRRCLHKNQGNQVPLAMEVPIAASLGRTPLPSGEGVGPTNATLSRVKK